MAVVQRNQTLYRAVSVMLWVATSCLLYFYYLSTYHQVQRDSRYEVIPSVAESFKTDAGLKSTSSASLAETTPMDNWTSTQTEAAPTTAVTKDPIDEYGFMGGIVDHRRNVSHSSSSVNPHPFRYVFNPKDVCRGEDGKDSEVFLLLYVHTRSANMKQRQMIRTTWGNENDYGLTVRRIFVMGVPETDVMEDALRLEWNMYKDIVQENFLDTYRNLTYKAVAALKWVSNYCSHAKFILKTDDDVFVNMPVLLRYLSQQYAAGEKHRRGRLICNVWYKSVVPRAGKWAVSEAERKHPIWPTFCQGLAFIMSTDVAVAFHNISYEVPFLWMDDVYITGFLARRLRLEHTQISSWYVFEHRLWGLFSSGGKQYKETVFAHTDDLNLIKWAWTRLTKLIESEKSSARKSKTKQ